METIAYLGPSGTYSEEVAQRLYGNSDGIEFVPYRTIDQAMRAVKDEEVTMAVVPIENSLGGSVNITLDILAHEVDLYIVCEATLAIEHALFLPQGELTEIVSHEQALAQCRHYIEENYPDIPLRSVKSTAYAVELAAAEGSTSGAIGSTRAGEVWGIRPVANAIGDTANNSTRFVVLAKKQTQVEGANVKTSIICQINGQKPGSLYDLLYEFKKHDVNLTRIESRPARTALGEYIFFFDLEGTPNEGNIHDALEHIQQRSNWYKHLGSYPIQQI